MASKSYIILLLTCCCLIFGLRVSGPAQADVAPAHPAGAVLSPLVESGVVSVNGSTNWPLSVATHMLIHEDTSQAQDLAQVLALPAGAGREWRSDLATARPFLSRSAWWIKLRIVNTDSQDIALRFSFDTANFGELDFYRKQNGDWARQHLGQAVSQARHTDAEHRRMAFPFVLSPGEQTDIVARISSDKRIILQPRLYSERAFSTNNDRQMVWLGVLFGGLAALTLGTLFIAGFALSPMFLLLSLLSLNVLLYEITASDYAQFYIWPTLTWWIPRASPTLGLASLALFLHFVMMMAEKLGIRWPARAGFRILLAMQAGLAVLAAFGHTYWVSWLVPFDIFLYGLSVVGAALILLKQALPGGRVMLLVSVYFLFQAALRYAGASELLPTWIHELTMNNGSNNPMLGLVGFYINLAVLMAWLVLILRQRSQAREALVRQQQEEQARLSTEVVHQTAALNKALAYADEKNRQKTEMLGYISHDLRAPAATIIGYAQLLAQHIDAPVDRQSHLQTIKRSADYQLKLIDELLEYARNELQPLSLNPEPVAMAAYLDEITNFAHALCAQEQNRFECVALTELPACVQTDAGRLQQVLFNILTNAAKFTKNGHIRMVVSAIGVATDDCSLQFAISDTGVGITTEDQSKIFSAFSQTAHAREGVGLGLFIAQHIVAKMGGEITVKSNPGQGSEFNFSIRCGIIDGTLFKWTATPILHTAQSPAKTQTLIDVWPPASARMELAELARDGRLTDIENWLRDVQATYPSCDGFITRVRSALNILDLTHIESLALAPGPA